MPRRRAPSQLTGPATRPAALAGDISDWQLRHPDVVRLSRDTYLPRAQDADLRTRLPAVLMTAPPGAVVSHQTAAALWRVEIPLAAPDPLAHLTVPAASKARNRADRRLHRAQLSQQDVERRWGMPVTTPARTWRDLAAVLEPAALPACPHASQARRGPLQAGRRSQVDRRQNRLVLEGWIVLRFSSADVLGRPDEVIAAVRRALGL
ncbi:hypothetical protein [Modestobacter altitudinis]|uniref:hypothetical protein n=1 Tax=Modestobacter altitudinis TaxID=2213158 RepID=UPI00110D0A8B|nr:hypothetical protein [Modestobacter altitudinis]